MKLGVNPIPDLDWRQIDWPAHARRWRNMGFGGAAVFIHKLLESDPCICRSRRSRWLATTGFALPRDSA